jgi:hypothetical protein
MTEVAARAGKPDGSRRVIPVLRALAASPAGLSTADLARQCAPDVKPWNYALTTIGALLRPQKAAGRVKACGTVPGGSALLWQITGEGRSFLGTWEENRALHADGRGKWAGRRRIAAGECRVTARRIALLRRQVETLARMEAGLTELEQVEREIEAFDGSDLAPSQPLS